jgi:hypothetical protein
MEADTQLNTTMAPELGEISFILCSLAARYFVMMYINLGHETSQHNNRLTELCDSTKLIPNKVIKINKDYII